MLGRVLCGTATTAALFLASPALAQETVPLVADDAYPPFSHVTDGTLAGVYPAILAAVFDRLEGYTVKTRAVPWSRALRTVETGEALGVYPPYASSGADRPYIDRYSEPIWVERVVLVCDRAQDTAGRTAWPDDFHGFRIGNNSGFRTPGDAFFAAVEAGDITLDEAPDAITNLRKLLAGRIDCYVNAALSIESGLVAMEASADERARIVEVLTVSENTAHIGYAADADAFPFKDDFADKVDTLLTEMKASGEIQAIVDGYFLK
ncbi:substrate-binding periplasmic protein [Roseospira goensis]|uniref:Polar amino acid transport system substrate-binding protein n=1 Tax=Roseospira goensis TaxID=391922 RepID=A0A7W6S2S0_9PROT|nr:transporter substrate-binding domain-containing protein [Roseospira goensis]MBB4287124.1 polar amino acid transport system substrate-binding protein [Roseospira goensis]